MAMATPVMGFLSGTASWKKSSVIARCSDSDREKVLCLRIPFRYAIRQIQGIVMSCFWEAIQED